MQDNKSDKSDKSDKSNDSDMPEGFTTRVGREKGDGWLKKTEGQVVMGRILGFFTMKNQEDDDGKRRQFFQFRIGTCTQDPKKGNCHRSADGGQANVKPWTPGVRANMTDEDKEKHEVVLLEGQVVNVDCHAALEELIPYTRDGGVYDVYLQYGMQEKIQGKGNRTFWNVRGPVLKTIKAPPPRQAPVRGGSGRNGEDDIPF